MTGADLRAMMEPFRTSIKTGVRDIVFDVIEQTSAALDAARERAVPEQEPGIIVHRAMTEEQKLAEAKRLLSLIQDASDLCRNLIGRAAFCAWHIDGAVSEGLAFIEAAKGATDVG